ncbi:lysine--tRNA ligase, partial [candidate division WWE3 bacterium]|nr:lysine--tRNA ligase [candidate division WWE3 bacterium]
MSQAFDLVGQRQQRLEKIEKLRSLGIDPYPAHANKDISNTVVTDEFGEYEGKTVSITGRVMSWRTHGKVIFADLLDQSGTAQAYIRYDVLEKDLAHGNLGWDELELIDNGDFVEVKGEVTKTKHGEPSVLASTIRIIAKAIRPLPESLENKEIRYRRRYIDLIVNPEIHERFVRKAKFWKANREFLEQNGFIEVETPVLEHVTGGADARPFITHHNDLDEDFYLRIST